MPILYTCTCGNQTWIVFDDVVRCTMCHKDYDVQNTPVFDFNAKAAKELEEHEAA